MREPLIAVVGYALPPGRISRWSTGAVAVPHSYLAALHHAGARPVVLAPADPLQQALFDALVDQAGRRRPDRA